MGKYLINFLTPRNRALAYHSVIVGLLFFIVCCESPSKLKERPINPWAIRSVLDYKPRMLTVALDSECYVAYDLKSCILYRAWKGGVNWDGAVFTEMKAIQPTVWGKDYYLNSFTNSWSVEKKGVNIPAEARFKGYKFVKGQIILNYQLIADGDTMLVTELPEFVANEKGDPGLERKFTTENVPGDVSLLLQTQLTTINLNTNAETLFAQFYEPLPKQVQDTTRIKSANVGKYWIEISDCLTCHEWTEKTVGPGFQQVADNYSSDDEIIAYLVNRVKIGGGGVWGTAVMNPHPNISESSLATMVKFILSLRKESDSKVRKIKKTKIAKESNLQEQTVVNHPGFGMPLEDTHPSFDVTTIHSIDEEYKVGGLAFLPEAKLVVSTWSPLGNIYLLEGVTSGDSSKVKAKIIANGLAEPLGLEVVDGKLFVLQKHELTQLIDNDGDDIIDEYKTVCNGFGVTSDFHEFAFGLVYKDGYFYVNLSLPLRLMANEKPHADRGKTLKIAMDGSFEWLIHGLRTPNGIGLGIDDELFVTDNQGQWLPANKLIHVRKGDFHGMRWNLPDSLSHLKMTPPTVWLPQDEIANSPSEPMLMSGGPYKNQVIFGDVSHGGIKRSFLEKVDGTYQGVVFRFTQGLEAGINRIVQGPDGALYVGGVGMSGGWSWQNKKHGLQRMIYNNKVTFEILAIRSQPNGFEIEFTEPLAAEMGSQPSDYLVQQWWYLPTEAYGGPKMDQERMTVSKVEVTSNRTKVRLDIAGLKPEHVVYFRLNDKLLSVSNSLLWSGEAWYTLNKIPQIVN